MLVCKSNLNKLFKQFSNIEPHAKAERRNLYKVNYDVDMKFGLWLRHVVGQGCIYFREIEVIYLFYKCNKNYSWSNQGAKSKLF